MKQLVKIARSVTVQNKVEVELDIPQEPMFYKRMEDWGIESIFAIIIGEPLEKDGSKSARVQSVTDFAIELSKHINIVIYFQDDAIINNELLKNYEEDEIKIDELQVPIIEYKDKKGLNKFWSPDVFLPKEKRIVETLPIWTHTRNPDRSFLRSNASILEGYKYELWLYDSKGNRISKKQSSLLASEAEALEPSQIPFPATQKQGH